MIKPITPEFLDKFAAAWNRHDVEGIVSMMTPDAVMCISGGPTVDGRRFAGGEQLRAGIAEIFKALPDAQWRNAKHFVADNRGVSEWTFTATRADGSKVEARGCDVFTFRDGLIVLKDSFRKQPTY